MTKGKRGQISVEYLVVVGFITFFLISMLGVALFYSSSIGDSMKINQLDHFARKVVSSAEGVYYAGEPSKSTLYVYLPSGVTGIEVYPKEIAFNISLSSGFTRTSYLSKAPLQGSISINNGVKKMVVVAASDKVTISSN